jgi:polysaccharide biosynthesis protein PelE
MPDIFAMAPRRAGIYSSFLVGLAALGDILLIQAWLSQDLSMILVIAFHLGLALAFGILSALLCPRPLSATVASFVILVLFGPFGGLALMMIAPGLGLPQARILSSRTAYQFSRDPQLHDAADKLFDQICQRRRHPLSGNAVSSFLKTFRSGTLHQQQEAIAAISRNYHPDMRPALSAALASPVPALRVQAAAVYAKLRGTYGTRAKDLLDQAEREDHARPALDANAFLEVAASGFVDNETREKLLFLASKLKEENTPPSVPSASASGPGPSRSMLRAMPRLKRYACGGLG